jgi:hypothetical protein
MSLFIMPFFGIASLLSNDREARAQRYKLLCGCRRKMVGSDSTFARVLKWLKPQESQAFLVTAHIILCISLALFRTPHCPGFQSPVGQAGR